MKRLNVFASILCLAFFSSISILGLAGCGGDSGPTPGGLAIITTSLPEGQINQPYSASVGGSGGALPYLWSVTPALPAGLSFNTQSGAITGTPGKVGTSSHTFTLVDSSIPPQTIETSLSLTIKPPLSITTTSLPPGNIGAVYGQPVQTVGGFGPLTFSIVPATGTLPQGLSLDPNTGVIAGTATATGNSSFTVRVADTSGQQDTQAFTIRHQPIQPATDNDHFAAGWHSQSALQSDGAGSRWDWRTHLEHPCRIAPTGSHDCSLNRTQCHHFRHSNHSRNLQLHGEGHRHLRAICHPGSFDYHQLARSAEYYDDLAARWNHRPDL